MSSPLLTVRDLKKSYGELIAVDGVSFEVAEGESYGLLGPNGAGKTTSISMICGLLKRDGGEVVVAGKKLDLNSVDAKQAIGYVPQDIALYPELSAKENLRFFGKLYGLTGKPLGEKVDQVLDLVGLTDR
ncbi:MAG: ATP-binding cassette domain-containing protein, partial [Acidimicrobiia bacterium]